MTDIPRFVGNALVATALLAAALVPTGHPRAQPPDALSVMSASPELTDWYGLVESVGLGGLPRSSHYTVFALTNASIAHLNAQVREMLYPTGGGANALPPDYDTMTRIVRSHVLAGMHPMSDFAGKVVTLRSINNLPITIDGTDPKSLKLTFRYAQAHTVGAPIISNNALIYPTYDDSEHY